MTAYFHLLRNNPDYTRLWLAQVVSLLGDWFSFIVLTALVSRYSGGSGLAVSGFLLAHFLPPLVMSPIAGVLVDRFNRRHLLILSDLFRALVVLMLLLANRPEMLWLIYVLTIIQFVFSAIFEPGRSALLPSLVAQSDLVLANTLGSVTWSVMLAIGGITGGAIATLFGTPTALVLDSATFVVSALLIASIKTRPQTNTPASPRIVSRPLRDFLDGLSYVRQHPAAAAALLVKTGLSLGNVDTLLVIYASQLFVMEGETQSLSILYSAFGLGAILGPLLLNAFNDGSIQTMRRLIAVGFMGVVLGWLLFGGAQTLWFAAFALVIRAMGGSVNWTYSSVIIQKSAPDALLGRMFSLDNAGYQLATVLSMVVTGLAVDLAGTANAPQIATATGMVSFVVLMGWVAATLRLERQERPAATATPGD